MRLGSTCTCMGVICIRIRFSCDIRERLFIIHIRTLTLAASSNSDSQARLDWDLLMDLHWHTRTLTHILRILQSTARMCTSSVTTCVFE